MVYRLARVEDLPALAVQRWDFRAEAGEPASETLTEFTARFVAFARTGLLSGQWAYWIAENSHGEIIAHMAVCTIFGVPRPTRSSDRWGYLTDCFTRAPERNWGVGTALLAHVRAWARATDLELLLVWPGADTTAWYERAGFTDAAGVRVLVLRGFDEPPREPTGTA